MGATPPEEIQKQQEEACEIVENLNNLDSKGYLEMVDHGEIPISQKQIPTEDYIRQEKDHHEESSCDEEKKEEEIFPFVVSSRGHVDISELAKLVYKGYNEPAISKEESKSLQEQKKEKKKTTKELSNTTAAKDLNNLWNEENAKEENINITRPSHDSWGIKKIVLVFSDDFLSRVYEMPWWWSSPTNTDSVGYKMKSAMKGIFETLQISEKQVIRMLFASLPPNVTIPVHHDSGEWVKHTHRVHVPIIVDEPDKILFRVGPTKDTLNRVNVKSGHVFEINNQAKHAVSNCSSKHRVHLILDYVDKTHPIYHTDRIQLSPGEILHQTRRSLDRQSDYGKTKTPSFIIIGAQKAGTTSLYEYIHQHPLCVKPRRRETHNLDWRWGVSSPSDKRSTKSSSSKQERCLSYYYTEYLKHHPSLITGDSTPSYLLHSDLVIPRLKAVFPHGPKILVMLRDPVSRAISHYKMVTDPNGTDGQKKTRGTQWLNKNIESVIYEEIEFMKKCGLLPYFQWKERTEEEETQLLDFDIDSQLFQSFVDTKEEKEAWSKYQNAIPMNTGSHCLVGRGIYHLQLRSWMSEFDSEKFLVLKMEDFSSSKEEMQDLMSGVYKFLELPFFYSLKDTSAKNSRQYEKPNTSTSSWLQKFYHLHNEQLQIVLKDKQGWKTNPWVYEEVP